MAMLETDDGVKLHYVEAGEGTPLVFVHEFAGDHRSFEPQLRHFARRYRAIAYNARGYPPSDVPDSADAYSQDRARDDIRAVLDALDIHRAHVVGVSMGGFAALHFGLAYPDRAVSLTLGGCGYGAGGEDRERFRSETRAFADHLDKNGMDAVAESYAYGPTRVQYQNKDPRGFAEFVAAWKEHSAKGAANTLRGVQSERASLYDLEAELRSLAVPTLVMAGDEDDPCLEASLYLKRAVPAAALAVLPSTGHALNLEEPGLFNQILGDFLHQVESGRWCTRDPRSLAKSLLAKR